MVRDRCVLLCQPVLLIQDRAERLLSLDGHRLGYWGTRIPNRPETTFAESTNVGRRLSEVLEERDNHCGNHERVRDPVLLNGLAESRRTELAHQECGCSPAKEGPEEVAANVGEGGRDEESIFGLDVAELVREHRHNAPDRHFVRINDALWFTGCGGRIHDPLGV